MVRRKPTSFGELFDDKGLLESAWEGKSEDLQAVDLAKAVQSLQGWDEPGRKALVAHFTVGLFALKNRLPMVAERREFAAAGGLATYGTSRPDLWRRSASYVDKIVRGANPADLPVEQPTRFELVINLKVAKAIGIDVPGMLLGRADEVIE
jgi:hypothetical protein